MRHSQALRPRRRPNRTAARPWTLAALFVILGFTAGSVPAQDAELQRMFRVPLPEDENLGWVSSAVWHDSGVLLLADVEKEVVIQVDPRLDGPPREFPLSWPGGGQGIRIPARIRGSGAEIWIEENPANRLFRLGRENEAAPVEILRWLDIESGHSEASPRMLAVWDFQPLGAGFLTYADFRPSQALEGAEAKDFSAFLYFDADGRNAVYREAETRPRNRDAYVRGLSYIAVIGDVGYILFLDEKLRLLEVHASGRNQGHRELEDLPTLGVPKATPDAHKAPGWRRALAFHEDLELARAAVGLFSWNDELYLLAKDRIHAGKTTWWLLRLDPRDGSERGCVELPTTAAHLTVAPGASWAFLEKSRVYPKGGPIGFPAMDAESVLFVPASAIERGASDGATFPRCRRLAAVPQ